MDMKNIEHFASEVIKLADMPLALRFLKLGCLRRKTLHDYLKDGTEDSSPLLAKMRRRWTWWHRTSPP